MSQQLIIEVIEGHHLAYDASRDPSKQRIEQKVYLHLGGAFPTESKIKLRTLQDQVPVGKYTLGLGAFQLGRYGDPEINVFELASNLEPIVQPAKKSA